MILGLITLLALATIANCQTRCPNPPSDWSVFCKGPLVTAPPDDYIFTIILEMPVTFFMDRSIQHCVMIGNGVGASPLRGAARGRLCLNRYDPVRVRQLSESIRLQFYEVNTNISGEVLVAGFSQTLTAGQRFPYPLYPYSEEFAMRFRRNYTNDFYFPVTYFGSGVTVGEEVFNPRGDRVRVGYSPFDVGDYFYAVLGTLAVGIVVLLILYGFFIQPYFS